MPHFYRTHHNHTCSLKAATRKINHDVLRRIDVKMDAIFAKLKEETIKECLAGCQMNQEGICQSTGKEIVLGSACNGQRISREASRR